MLESGWYRVTATDANGCQEEAIIEVEKSLDILCIKKNIVITPNGDGLNDYYYPLVTTGATINSCVEAILTKTKTKKIKITVGALAGNK